MSLITVVLGADGDADAKEFDSFADTVTLLDWCFANYSCRTLVEKGYAAAVQPLEADGVSGSVTLLCAQEIRALAANGMDVSQLKKTVELSSDTLPEAPAEGTVLGTVSFFDPEDGTLYGSSELVAAGDAQFEQPTPTPAPQELSHEQKLATVIVCAIAVFLLLLFVLLLVRREKRRRSRRKRKTAMRH